MQRGYPCIYRGLGLEALEPINQERLVEPISEFIERLEELLPSEHQECLMYALFLIEKGFAHGIFVHSATIVR